jgi:S1-C subfamily serine protease
VLVAFNLPLSATGVVVENPGPYGARFGMQTGDVILDINGVEITGTGQVAQALALGTRSLTVTLQRGLQRLSLRSRL